MPVNSEGGLGSLTSSGKSNLRKLTPKNNISVNRERLFGYAQFSKPCWEIEGDRIPVVSAREDEFDFEPHGRLRAPDRKVLWCHQIAYATCTSSDLL